MISLSHFPLIEVPEFEKVECLVFYDVELINHVRQNGRDYLAINLDFEEGPPQFVDRWLYFRVTLEDINDHQAFKLSMNQILPYRVLDSYVCICDEVYEGGELSYKTAYMVPKNQIPTEYLPEKDSFLSKD